MKSPRPVAASVIRCVRVIARWNRRISQTSLGDGAAASIGRAGRPRPQRLSGDVPRESLLPKAGRPPQRQLSISNGSDRRSTWRRRRTSRGSSAGSGARVRRWSPSARRPRSSRSRTRPRRRPRNGRGRRTSSAREMRSYGISWNAPHAKERGGASGPASFESVDGRISSGRVRRRRRPRSSAGPR